MYLHAITLGVKAVFHFNRIVAKRSLFHCFETTQVELMTTLRFATIRLRWKTGLIVDPNSEMF